MSFEIFLVSIFTRDIHLGELIKLPLVPIDIAILKIRIYLSDSLVALCSLRIMSELILSVGTVVESSREIAFVRIGSDYFAVFINCVLVLLFRKEFVGSF